MPPPTSDVIKVPTLRPLSASCGAPCRLATLLRSVTPSMRVTGVTHARPYYVRIVGKHVNVDLGLSNWTVYYFQS